MDNEVVFSISCVGFDLALDKMGKMSSQVVDKGMATQGNNFQ